MPMTGIDGGIGAAGRSKISRRLRAGVIATLMIGAAACASPEQKYDRYIKSGEAYLEEGKLGLANVQYQNALKIKEDSVDAMFGLASIAEKRANYQQMFGILQRIERVAPENARAKLDLAKLYLLGDDTARALDSLNAVIEKDPKNAEAIAVKAAVMFRIQNTAEAVDLAKQALALDPKSQEAIAVLASERVTAKDLEGALSILDSAVKADPKAAVLHILRLQVLTDLGRSSDVDAAYVALIEEFPEDANYRRLYTTRLIEENKLEEARAQLEEVARLLPRQRDPKLDLVRIDFRIGGRERAEATFKKLIAENSDDYDLQRAYGTFLREQGDYAAADEAYHVILREKGVDLPEVIRTKNEIAALKLIEKKRPEAEKLIGEILAADATDPDALIKRAGLKITDGDIDGAIADLRVVIGEHPDSLPARLLTASALEQKGDYKFAETEYAQAVQVSNRNAQASNLFARFLMRRGETARAERILAESIAVNPNNEENLKLLAGLRLQQQDWRGAEEAANILSNVSRGDEDVSRILGAAYTGLKDYAGAIDVLKREYDRAPLAARPLAGLIQAYVNAGRTAEAETFLRDTIEKNPDFYEAHVLLAQLERVNGRADVAVASLEKAIELEPLRSEAYEALYGVYVLEGRRDDAGKVIEQATAAIPDNDGLQVLKADHLIAVADNDGAISIYETILARRPNDLIVANNLASLLADRDDASSIDRAFEAAQPLKGTDNPYFLDTLGWALFRGGKAAEGVAALEAAVEGAPALADARYHLGYALAESGETVRAKEQLDAAVAAPGASADIVAKAKAKLATLN